MSAPPKRFWGHDGGSATAIGRRPDGGWARSRILIVGCGRSSLKLAFGVRSATGRLAQYRRLLDRCRVAATRRKSLAASAHPERQPKNLT